jgi:multidrug efflux pump subunit AcrA (membrane-fusion protein)
MQVAVGYAVVKAPMSGRVGEIKVHVGSLVQPNTTLPMTTIIQVDPIEVAFNIPEREVRKLLAAQRAGPVPVRAHVENRIITGRLSFIDSAVDSTAGSLKAKAEFKNPDGLLWSGTLVIVDLSLRILQRAVVISPRAVQVGPQGQFVYRIEPDGRVSSQSITGDYLTSDMAVVQGIQGRHDPQGILSTGGHRPDSRCGPAVQRCFGGQRGRTPSSHFGTAAERPGRRFGGCQRQRQCRASFHQSQTQGGPSVDANPARPAS